MTIKVPKKVEDALLDPTTAYNFLLSIDQLEVGDLISEGEWGGNEDGSIYVNFTIADKLPLDTTDVPSAFALLINDTVVPQMAGVSSLPDASAGLGTSKFLAASAMAVAGDFPFDEYVTLSGVTPEYALKQHVVRRLPYYIGASNIASVQAPLLYLAFAPEDSISELIDEIEKQSSLVLRDNALGGLTATPAFDLDASAVKEYRRWDARDFKSGWQPPPRVERRYSEVVVYARGQDGEYAFEPQRQRVRYANQSEPPAGAILYIQLDDISAGAAQRARNLARDSAKRLARGGYRADSLTLPMFDPLLEPQDPFFVYEIWEDMRGLWDRGWLCWVDTFKHYRQTLSTEVSYSASLMYADRILSPALAVAGITGGLKKTVLELCDEINGQIILDESLSWVKNHDGEILLAEDSGNVFENDGELRIICPVPTCVERWYEDGNDIVFDSSLPWVAIEGNDIVFDEAAASGAVATSGNDIVVDFTNSCVPYSKPLWGEDVPGEVFFDPSVAWATVEGNEIVIDEAASGSNAWVEGNDLVFS